MELSADVRMSEFRWLFKTFCFAETRRIATFFCLSMLCVSTLKFLRISYCLLQSHSQHGYNWWGFLHNENYSKIIQRDRDSLWLVDSCLVWTNGNTGERRQTDQWRASSRRTRSWLACTCLLGWDRVVTLNPDIATDREFVRLPVWGTGTATY